MGRVRELLRGRREEGEEAEGRDELKQFGPNFLKRVIGGM
jgi:hypothetical protein